MAAESDDKPYGLGYVVASSHRRAIVMELADGAATPSELAEKTGLNIAHASRALNQLRDRDPAIVELLVHEDCTKGRLYGLSDHGHELVTTLKEVR